MDDCLRKSEIIMGDLLTTQSELDGSRVINADSIRGPELSKLIDEKVYLSYNLKDSVIIFDISERDGVDITMEDEDGNIIKETPLECSVTIYGNGSLTLANKLKARLESAEVRVYLLENDLFLESVSVSPSIKEFINNTIWIRNDLTINLVTESKFNKILIEEEMESAENRLHIIKTKN